MAIFTILYGNYYPPHGEFELICIGKFARRTWVNFTQQYGKNRQRWQQNTFTMLYGNYCYIFIENFPQKFSPCRPTNLIAAVYWAVWEIVIGCLCCEVLLASLLNCFLFNTEKKVWFNCPAAITENWSELIDV